KMAETQTLNFGPEWLRALSGGGGSSSVASPPLSPAMPKYKLADYRYGREEMLALYVKDNKIPIDLHDKEFLPILQEEPLLPLALVPFTEEEQRKSLKCFFSDYADKAVQSQQKPVKPLCILS
uniref:GRB10 interacting GYF protein 2 n=1 Tax=Pygocentrus nattereri TaxID=42514 RepID=A0AAR2LLR3_PYGNA